MNKTQVKKYFKIQYLAALLISVFIGCAMLFASTLAERNRAATSDFSEGWTTSSKETVDIDDLDTRYYNGTIVVTKKLPNRVNYDDSLCFVGVNVNITVFVDGHCEYRYSQPENFTGRGYGQAYHIVNLSEEDEGGIVKIVYGSVFNNGAGGKLRMMSLENSRDYCSRISSGMLLPYNISIGVLCIGILLLFLRLILPVRKNMPSIVALGITAVLAGVWLATDTGFLRLNMNAVKISRVTDFILMHVWVLPLSVFVYTITRERRRIYLITAYILSAVDTAFFLIMRFVFDRDMSSLTGYFAVYICWSFILIAIMLISDHIYCRKMGFERSLRFFFTGLGFLFITTLADVIVFLSGVRSVSGRGNFSRVGACVFFGAMGLETIRIWSREQASINRDRFINKMLQYAVSATDPENSIKSILEYFGNEFHSDHVFLYENRNDGTYHLTYEWFNKNSPARPVHTPDISSGDMIERLYEDFKKEHRLIVDDSEATREMYPDLYKLMKKAYVRNMVAGPLEVGANLTGLLGIEDVPPEDCAEIAEIMWLVSYFVSQLIIQRDEKRNLERMSYIDSLTGARNRRSLDEFEAAVTGVYPYGYIMCDINGLKMTNDTVGHEEGDELIKDVAESLTTVFGHDQVFRMGGDEFVVYSLTDTEESFRSQIFRARSLISNKHRSAAMGGVFVTDGSMDTAEIKRQAEELMYAEKEEYYKGNNDRRSQHRS